MIDHRTAKAIEASDTDELIRVVDGHVASRDWTAMAELRGRCDEAVTRGKQLWGISEYILYRFALDGPGEWAGPAVGEGHTRFTLGPLPEVAASTKTWAELDPYLPVGPERAVTAHERVVRGEDLRQAEIDPHVMELPLRLESWEPRYALATYHGDRVEAPAPPAPGSFDPNGAVREPRVVEDPDGCRALLSLVEHWVENSNGRAQAVCVEGPVAAAIAALGVGSGRSAPITPELALAWMAWAAASGGAHGRRRGAAAGRFSAWWAAHELAGLDWPAEPADLGEAITHLRWYAWSDGSPDTGWALRLGVESPSEGLAWSLTATDAD